jgi:hypothetical protein
MDERIEKAFGVANYMATLSNQRRVILEEYNQNLIHYVNGATFKITYELIGFVKTLVDMGKTENVVLVDSNNFPVLINDLEDFLNSIVSTHLESVSTYADKFNEIKVKRKIADIVDL